MNKLEMEPKIQEILNMLLVKALIEKLYKKDLIAKFEYKLLISECNQKIDTLKKEWEMIKSE